MQGSKWVLAVSLLSAVSFELLSDAGAMQLLCGNLWNLVGKEMGKQTGPEEMGNTEETSETA